MHSKSEEARQANEVADELCTMSENVEDVLGQSVTKLMLKAASKIRSMVRIVDSFEQYDSSKTIAQRDETIASLLDQLSAAHAANLDTNNKLDELQLKIATTSQTVADQRAQLIQLRAVIINVRNFINHNSGHGEI